MKEYLLENAYLHDGWARDVHITISARGDITSLSPDSKSKDTPVIKGFAIPGIPNTHSHAFQRALSGLTEVSSGDVDNFWSWREMMYALAGKIGPQEMYCIAAQLYMEMLKAGYTTVAEFHYLHHQAEGSAYANPTEMSLALLQAARDTGIGLTLLPVLYMTSGFNNQPLLPQQARFYHSTEAYCRLLDVLRKAFSGHNQTRLGSAFHSLRAVSPGAITAVLDYLKDDLEAPIHIHISEQLKEIEDCLAWSGKRPLAWLLDEHDIDARWCLVHATHIDETENTRLAAAGACVSICPTTEANLGDGLFPLASFLQQGGRIAIGSDSNISISPVEELRWLEYGQRLVTNKRNVVASEDEASCGTALLQRVLAGGAQACAQNIGAIAVGCRADILVLDGDSDYLLGKPRKYLLDSFIFSGNTNLVKDVMTAGNWVVKDKQHQKQSEIGNAYRTTIKQLYQELA